MLHGLSDAEDPKVKSYNNNNKESKDLLLNTEPDYISTRSTNATTVRSRNHGQAHTELSLSTDRWPTQENENLNTEVLY